MKLFNQGSLSLSLSTSVETPLCSCSWRLSNLVGPNNYIQVLSIYLTRLDLSVHQCRIYSYILLEPLGTDKRMFFSPLFALSLGFSRATYHLHFSPFFSSLENIQISKLEPSTLSIMRIILYRSGQEFLQAVNHEPQFSAFLSVTNGSRTQCVTCHISSHCKWDIAFKSCPLLSCPNAKANHIYMSNEGGLPQGVADVSREGCRWLNQKIQATSTT